MDENGAPATVSADEFAALEGKVLQTIELVKREREARAVAEEERNQAQGELAMVREELRAHAETGAAAQSELELLRREREGVRQRVEYMLHSMDELL